jgi:hypothetical protein
LLALPQIVLSNTGRLKGSAITVDLTSAAVKSLPEVVEKLMSIVDKEKKSDVEAGSERV